MSEYSWWLHLYTDHYCLLRYCSISYSYTMVQVWYCTYYKSTRQNWVQVLIIQYSSTVYGRLRISCPKISPQNQLNIYFGVGDHPYFLTFITTVWSLSTVKLLSFPCTCKWYDISKRAISGLYHTKEIKINTF